MRVKASSMSACVNELVVSLGIFLHMCERVTSWVMNEASESHLSEVIMSVMSVCNHEGAMGRAIEQERERERANQREVRKSDGDPKGQMLRQVIREEFWENYNAVVLCFLCIGIAVSH